MAAAYFHDELVVPQPPPPHNPAPSTPATPFHAYGPPSPLSTPPGTSLSPSLTADHPQTAIPKVGQTRCYWALLSADLQFIYLDPVLAGHLEEQADSLVGQSLLTFVHPDERETARQDLGSVLDSKTLHGSVTRVRFSRLSKVRRDLGYTGPGTPWPEADKIALDDQYMAVEIVINWAADGLVLCFIHASIDLSPSDNDEQQKTQWTNWCGTPFMSQDQVSLLFRRLLMCIPQTGTTNRVFQILSNDPGRSILLSWPPDPSHLAEVSAVDLAKLVETVNMGTALSGVSNDAKTSCTRRYKALKQDTPTSGGQVESIFIPHGSIIFACHKVSPSSRGPVNSTSGMQHVALPPAYNSHSASASYYDPNPYSVTLPPISTQEPYTYMPQHHQGPQYSPQRWSQSVPAALSNLRSNSYVHQSAPQDQSWHSSRSQSTYVEAPNGNRGGDSPTYTVYSPTTTVSGISPTTDNVVPPPKRKLSPTSAKGEHASTGRNSANRPAGLLACSSCKTTNSPEWRKGPSGKKELCNACGLRYARSRAKKEGHQTQSQRRRKTSTTAKQTLLSTTSPYSGPVRRLYDSGSYSSSAGPPPSVDVYSNGSMGPDTMTPSPSPPGTAMSFMSYSESRPAYTDSGSFYTTSPSTLSSSAMSHTNEPSVSSHMSSGHPPIACTQLPPISTYVDRLVPSTSPLTHSSFATTLPPASYERDRERDRDYRSVVPTPLSAESRMKREILSQH